MKIILSRKGFDAKAGGCPSPIMPDGSLVSFPIPVPSKLRYEKIASGISRFPTMLSLINQLRREPLRRSWEAHLDPDLRRDSRDRVDGWRPLFGQTDQSLTHLVNNGVGIGSLFLFYGWFKRTVEVDGKLRWDRRSRGMHILFGYLFVEEAWDIGRHGTDGVPPWASNHPHVVMKDCYKRGNVLFAAARNCTLSGRSYAGGGAFRYFDSKLQLSELGMTRSHWVLPKWFFPFEKPLKKTPLTYHGERSRWKLGADHVRLRTVGRGQEFVFDSEEYPEALIWVENLISGSELW